MVDMEAVVPGFQLMKQLIQKALSFLLKQEHMLTLNLHTLSHAKFMENRKKNKNLKLLISHSYYKS